MRATGCKKKTEQHKFFHKTYDCFEDRNPAQASQLLRLRAIALALRRDAEERLDGWRTGYRGKYKRWSMGTRLVDNRESRGELRRDQNKRFLDSNEFHVHQIGCVRR